MHSPCRCRTMNVMMHSSTCNLGSDCRRGQAGSFAVSRRPAAFRLRHTQLSAALPPHQVHFAPPAHCAAQSASRSLDRGAGLASISRGGSAQLLRQVSAPALQQEAGAAASANDSSARQQVLDLLAAGHGNYEPQPGMPAAVDALIASSSVADPAPATFRLGQGVWEVFQAPHIRALSGLMAIRFDPVRYTLQGDQLYSNVGYKLPLGLGGGWLSAAGTLTAQSDDALTLHFDRFWVDRGAGEPLRPDISAEAASTGWDGLVSRLGRAFFFDGLASFPVQYVDSDLTVFRFPPLRVSIAAQRV